MRLIRKGCLILTVLLVGCTGSYHDIGKYSSNVEGQNNAVASILENYNSLPSDGYYKIEYAFPNPNPLAPIKQIKHAFWYNKSENILALEVDIPSGVMCRWMSVPITLLERASRSNNSMAVIDSLGKPDQPIALCQYYK